MDPDEGSATLVQEFLEFRSSAREQLPHLPAERPPLQVWDDVVPAVRTAATAGMMQDDLAKAHHPLVFEVPLLTNRACQELRSHLSAAQKAWDADVVASLDPTLFHSKGLVGEDCCLQAWSQSLVGDVLSPLIKQLFTRLPADVKKGPLLRGVDVQDFLCFYLPFCGGERDVSCDQTPLHVDESVFTINVCLHCDQSSDTSVMEFQSACGDHDDETMHTDVTVPFKTGNAVIFTGDTPHRVAGGGPSRDQLILYVLARTPKAAKMNSRLFARESSSGVKFYERYQLYLFQKYARTLATRDLEPTGTPADKFLNVSSFVIPSMPAFHQRVQRSIHAARCIEQPTDGEAESEVAHMVAPALEKTTTFLFVEELVQAVASFGVIEDLTNMSSTCRLWRDFIEPLQRTHVGARWEERRTVATAKSCSSLGHAAGSEYPSTIVVSCGGIGNSMCSYFFESLAVNSGLGLHGEPTTDAARSNSVQNAFLHETNSGNFKANAVLVDTDAIFEPPADEFSVSPRSVFAGISTPLTRWRQFYDGMQGGDQLRCEGTAHMALPMNCLGSNVPLIDEGKNRLRQQLERTDKCNALVAMAGVGGGSGATLLDAILDPAEFGKKVTMEVPVLPSYRRDAYQHLASYNAVLHMGRLHEKGRDLALVFSNDALHAAHQRHTHKSVVYDPYVNTQHAAKGLIAATASMWQGDGALNVDIQEMHTNLVPYPTMRYLDLAHGQPMCSGYSYSVAELVNGCFEPYLQLSYVLPTRSASTHISYYRGKHMAVCLGFLGDVVPKDVMAAVATIKTKRTIEFVDWCPTGFKCGINYRQIVRGPSFSGGVLAPQRSVVSTANNERHSQNISIMNHAFDKLYSKRSFVHHYIQEGMEEGQFSEAREALAALEKDYEEVFSPTPEDEDAEDDEY